MKGTPQRAKKKQLTPPSAPEMKKNRKIRGEITSRKIPTFGAAGEKPVESKEATSEESKEEASSKFAATFGAGGKAQIEARWEILKVFSPLAHEVNTTNTSGGGAEASKTFPPTFGTKKTS